MISQGRFCTYFMLYLEICYRSNKKTRNEVKSEMNHLGKGQIFKILCTFIFRFRIATDIVEERLNLAKQLGADILINGLKDNLQETGMYKTSDNMLIQFTLLLW